MKILPLLKIRFRVSIFFCYLSLVIAGCSVEHQEKFEELQGQLGVLSSLHKEIKNTLENGDAGVRLNNNRFLIVTLLNTELNQQSDAVRKKRAQIILGMIKSYKNKHDELETIDVVLVQYIEKKKKFLIVNLTRTIDVYEFNINSLLDQSSGECPQLKSDLLTGLWNGEKSFPDEGSVQIWSHERKADNTSEIIFFKEDGKSIDYTQTGTWAIDGCLLTMTITHYDDELYDYENVQQYRVHVLTDSHIQYSSIQSSTRYEMFKDSSQ